MNLVSLNIIITCDQRNIYHQYLIVWPLRMALVPRRMQMSSAFNFLRIIVIAALSFLNGRTNAWPVYTHMHINIWLTKRSWLRASGYIVIECNRRHVFYISIYYYYYYSGRDRHTFERGKQQPINECVTNCVWDFNHSSIFIWKRPVQCRGAARWWSREQNTRSYCYGWLQKLT